MPDAVLRSGSWSPARRVSGMAVLLRRGQTWMSITPREPESQEMASAAPAAKS